MLELLKLMEQKLTASGTIIYLLGVSFQYLQPFVQNFFFMKESSFQRHLWRRINISFQLASDSTFSNETPRWCNGQRIRLEYGRSWLRATNGSNQRLKKCICCFSAKHAALRRKSKDQLARNQDNVTSGETCLSSDWYFIELAQ